MLSVDYAPEDLYDQVPFSCELVRSLSGADRDDYWLGRLDRPLRHATNDGLKTIHHVILVSRYEGETIYPRTDQITVGISFVLDESQVDLPALDLTKCLYVAIGEVKIGAAS